MLPTYVSEEARKWFEQFAKVFNPRVLLMLVINAAFFFGNLELNHVSRVDHTQYAFAIISYIWLAILGLEALIMMGIVTYDQRLETKHSYPPQSGSIDNTPEQD